jgi:hypothetical protein
MTKIVKRRLARKLAFRGGPIITLLGVLFFASIVAVAVLLVVSNVVTFVNIVPTQGVNLSVVNANSGVGGKTDAPALPASGTAIKGMVYDIGFNISAQQALPAGAGLNLTIGDGGIQVGNVTVSYWTGSAWVNQTLWHGTNLIGISISLNGGVAIPSGWARDVTLRVTYNQPGHYAWTAQVTVPN